MMIDDNGVIREMVPTEIAEYKKFMAEMDEAQPSPEERIAVLEEALEMILSGVTE